MILGIGLDLCDIPRIERALQKPRFLERVYTQAERERIAERGAATAAGFFAAKEAAAKALLTGFRGFGLQDIEIVNDELGAPRVRLHNGARARMLELNGKSMLVSITHIQGVAAATAILTDQEG